MDSCLAQHADRGTDLQRPCDIAVVTPTLLRPSLLDAVRSVYTQDFAGRIQLLIGIDKPEGDCSVLDALIAERPSHCVLTIFYPGYSTAMRHGGIHPACDGGALRSTLIYLANARCVALLDDDNWWDSGHLRQMRAALDGRGWAYARRWFVHPETRRPICVDQWESVGPHLGYYRQSRGGWVDPNCLLFDKIACEPVIRCWSVPPPMDFEGRLADRHAFHTLATNFPYRASEQATVYYVIGADDAMQQQRLAWIGEEAYSRAGGVQSCEAASPRRAAVRSS